MAQDEIYTIHTHQHGECVDMRTKYKGKISGNRGENHHQTADEAAEKVALDIQQGNNDADSKGNKKHGQKTVEQRQGKTAVHVKKLLKFSKNTQHPATGAVGAAQFEEVSCVVVERKLVEQSHSVGQYTPKIYAGENKLELCGDTAQPVCKIENHISVPLELKI